MGMTLAEKILAAKTGRDSVSPGEIVNPEPDRVMSHDNSAAIAGTFEKMGVARVWDPGRIVIVLDHAVPPPNNAHAENHRRIRQFVSDQGIEDFFDINHGVCHTVMCENGLAEPWALIVGSDSHMLTQGALGAFAAGIGRTETASVWALGRIWLRVPTTIRVRVHGQLGPMITAKDVALRLLAEVGAAGFDYRAVEFEGEAIDAMSVDERMVLCNLMAEAGAKTALVAPDDKTREWLQGRVEGDWAPLEPDSDAEYERTIELAVGDLEPHVALPHSPANGRPIAESAGTPIDQVFIGSCNGGLFDDLRRAAEVLKGQRVASGTRLVVIPASWKIYRQAMEGGIISTFIEAGAVICNPGCGPCLGAHQGCLAAGEKCLSTSNRNFCGRMGCRDAEIYLAGPTVAAATAIAGKIADPRK